MRRLAILTKMFQNTMHKTVSISLNQILKSTYAARVRKLYTVKQMILYDIKSTRNAEKNSYPPN